MDHKDYMRRALELAAQATKYGDVPVGCVIVKDGEIIGEGRNRREENGDATAHAELEAIRDACRRLGSWRLSEAELYVTLEPCPMCAGAILNARIGRVYYGARDRAMGAVGSVSNLFMEDYPNCPAVVGGILAEECAAALQRFFSELRTGE